jgi:hypothetical protein
MFMFMWEVSCTLLDWFLSLLRFLRHHNKKQKLIIEKLGVTDHCQFFEVVWWVWSFCKVSSVVREHQQLAHRLVTSAWNTWSWKDLFAIRTQYSLDRGYVGSKYTISCPP